LRISATAASRSPEPSNFSIMSWSAAAGTCSREAVSTVCESSDHRAAAANRPSLLPKCCITNAGSTPAAAATARMVARS
jgi:hypothetical protein